MCKECKEFEPRENTQKGKCDCDCTKMSAGDHRNFSGYYISWFIKKSKTTKEQEKGTWDKKTYFCRLCGHILNKIPDEIQKALAEYHIVSG
jgi:hypothetical protein